MPVSKTEREKEPVAEKYVVDLYGDVEYMCGGNYFKVRNAMVRTGADRVSAFRPDIYNGVVSWTNPDGSAASFVSSGGGAALVTVRSCVIRNSAYPPRVWSEIDGFAARQAECEKADASLNAAVSALCAALDGRNKTAPSDPARARIAAAAEEALDAWTRENSESRRRWERLSADHPGTCAVYLTPADWKWITDAADIDAGGEGGDPREQAFWPGETEPRYVTDVRRWLGSLRPAEKHGGKDE